MSARDKDELILNPVTGELDMIRKFNPDRLITSSLNSAGNPHVEYDVQSGLYIEAGPQLIYDSEGNVVTT